jgi:hypothetical protein
MTDSISGRALLKWTVLPVLNFIAWYFLALHHRGCPVLTPSLTHSPFGSAGSSSKVVYNYSACSSYGLQLQPTATHSLTHSHMPTFISPHAADSFQFGKLKMDRFEDYKKDELVHLKSAAKDLFELNFHDQPCTTYVHSLTESKPFTCLAVVTTPSNPGSLNMLRFNKDNKKTGRVYNMLRPAPAGIFRNVANKKGRISQRSYTEPFLENIQEVESQILAMMARRGLAPGNDVTLMVTNDGEIDLFLNYACSCRAHNISLNNAIVFTGSRCVCLLYSDLSCYM